MFLRITWPEPITKIPPNRMPSKRLPSMRMATGSGSQLRSVTVDGTPAVGARNSRAPIPAGPFAVNPAARRLPPSIDLCRDLMPAMTQWMTNLLRDFTPEDAELLRRAMTVLPVEAPSADIEEPTAVVMH